MSYLPNSTEYLEIDGVCLQTPAWTVENLGELWSPAQTRGSDRLIPGVAGVRSYPRRKTETRRTLKLVIFGDVNWLGAAYANPRIGLQTNLAHLKANVVDPAVGNGTRAAILHMPDGSTRTGLVTVESLQIGDTLGDYDMPATLDLTLPAGELT